MLPSVFLYAAVYVVVAGHQEQAFPGQFEPLQQFQEKIRGSGVFFRLAPVGDIAGAAQSIQRPLSQQVLQIALPGIAQHAAAAPGFFFAPAPFVQVGNVQEAQGVFAHSRHSFHGSMAARLANFRRRRKRLKSGGWDKLHASPHAAILAVMEHRLLTLFSGIPKDVNFADELIAERKAEAKRENKA